MDLTLLQPPMLTHSGVEIARYKNSIFIGFMSTSILYLRPKSLFKDQWQLSNNCERLGNVRS